MSERTDDEENDNPDDEDEHERGYIDGSIAQWRRIVHMARRELASYGVPWEETCGE